MNDQTKWFLDVANAFRDGLEAGFKSVKDDPPDYFQKMFEMDAEEIQKVDMWLKRNGGSKMGKFRFELGEFVRDTVTGCQGAITARCEYMFENPRYCLENSDENGRPVEMWFDENRLTRTVNCSGKPFNVPLVGEPNENE